MSAPAQPDVADAQYWSRPNALTRVRARAIRFLFFSSRLPYPWVRVLVRVIGGNRVYLGPVHTFQVLLRLSDVLQTRLLLDGLWEPPFSRWWAYLASQSSVVFDVGAHCGYYSLLAKAESPDVEIYAFEPGDTLRAQFEASLSLNGMDSGVTVSASAVSNQAGPHVLYVRDIEPATASLFEPDEDYDRTVPVTAIRLDDYRRQHDIGEVDVVKFDIEGAEALALEGSRDGLRAQEYRLLMIEMHRVLMPPGLAEATRDLLTEAGYALFRIEETTARPLDLQQPIPEYDQWLAASQRGLDDLEEIRDGAILRLPARYADIYAGAVWSPA
jgi:FkbM family methyltransferase